MTTNRPPRQAPIAQALLIFQVAMALVYVGVGLFLALHPNARLLIGEEYAPIFGGAIVGYGLFRGLRTWRSWRSDKKGLETL